MNRDPYALLRRLLDAERRDSNLARHGGTPAEIENSRVERHTARQELLDALIDGTHPA